MTWRDRVFVLAIILILLAGCFTNSELINLLSFAAFIIIAAAWANLEASIHGGEWE